MRDLVIAPDEVPEVIDELPVLATLGTFGGSVTVSGAGELRVKESDRIAELVAGLRAMGADADERPDGFQVRRGARLTGGTVHAQHDHRLAMAFAIAALGASGPTHIEGADAVAVSYPAFFEDLDRLAHRRDGDRRAREDRQDLPGRLHGRRQDDPWPARSASASTGRSKTSTRASSAPNAATSRRFSGEAASPISGPASARRCIAAAARARRGRRLRRRNLRGCRPIAS